MKILRSKTYILPGPCIPLARARFAKGRVFDNQKQLKLIAGIHLRSQHNNEPLFASTPLKLEVTFYIEIPKTRLRHIHEGDYCFYKPDNDNLIKFIADIASKVIYVDDSLLAVIISSKKYSKDARTEFTVSELK